MIVSANLTHQLVLSNSRGGNADTPRYLSSPGVSGLDFSPNSLLSAESGQTPTQKRAKIERVEFGCFNVPRTDDKNPLA